jgi:hemerythrin-like domain-containing protein
MNGFRYVHKAIRHELDILEGMAGPSAANELQVPAFGQRMGFLRSVVKLHAASEDEVMYPALDGKVPQVTRSYALDHQYEEDIFDQIERTLASLSSAPAGGRRSELSQQLHRRLIALNATLSLHIWKEEGQLLSLLDEHFSLHEQGAMAAGIVAHIPPQMMQRLLPFMLDALTIDEREDFLRTVLGGVPAEAARGLKAGVRAHLPPADWAEISKRLPEMASA